MTDKQAPESRGTEVALLPCPFCAAACYCDPHWRNTRGEAMGPYAAGCLSCQVHFTAETPAGAIGLWNRRSLLATQRSTESAVRGDAEALRDAARYRWLRAQSRVTVDQSPLKEAYRFARWVEPEDVDAAIDAALAQTPEGKDEPCPKP